MHKQLIASLLALIFSSACLASGASSETASKPVAKPHQPTSVHAPDRQ